MRGKNQNPTFILELRCTESGNGDEFPTGNRNMADFVMRGRNLAKMALALFAKFSKCMRCAEFESEVRFPTEIEMPMGSSVVCQCSIQTAE